MEQRYSLQGPVSLPYPSVGQFLPGKQAPHQELKVANTWILLRFVVFDTIVLTLYMFTSNPTLQKN